MVKDEDLCVHCGLCAERCPTAAWDMQKSTIKIPLRRATRPRHAHSAADAQDRVNDFVIKLANVNGTGSASANALLMKSIFRMGVPVMGKNYFPSNIQGLPTWYEIRVTQRRLRRALGPHRPHGRDERRDLRARTCAKSAPGGYLIYDSTWPRPALLARDDITILGVPLAQHLQREFRRRAHAHPDEEHLLRGRARARCSTSTLDVIRELLAETYAKKPALVDSNMKAVAARLRLREASTSSARCRCACQRMDKTAGHIMIDGNTAAGARLRVRRRDGRRVVSDHAVDLADGRVQELLRTSCASIRRPASNNFAVIQAEDELAAIGMVLGAIWNGARAFTPTSGPGISLMNEFIGLAYYAEVPGRDLRHPARRARRPACRRARSSATS